MDDLAQLTRAIDKKAPKLVSSISNADPIFAFVRTACHYSMEACHILQLERFKNVHILNVRYRPSPAFVHVNDFSSATDVPVPADLLKTHEFELLAQRPAGDTVPQIFVRQNGVWYYVGGCNELKNTQIVPPDNVNSTNRLMLEDTKPALTKCTLKM